MKSPPAGPSLEAVKASVTPPLNPVSIDHYALAFSLLSEQCFRFIQHDTRLAQHCPYITEWRGRFKDCHAVEACDGTGSLDAARWIAGSAPVRSGLPWSR